MVQVMRSLDAIGSLILDFAGDQKIVGIWATLMDPLDLQIDQDKVSYNFDFFPFYNGIEQKDFTEKHRKELEQGLERYWIARNWAECGEGTFKFYIKHN